MTQCMCVDVCVCIYIHIYLYIRTHHRAHAHARAHTRARTVSHLCMHAYMHMYTQVFTYSCTRSSARAHMPTCRLLQTDTCAHTHIHTFSRDHLFRQYLHTTFDRTTIVRLVQEFLYTETCYMAIVCCIGVPKPLSLNQPPRRAGGIQQPHDI